MKTDVNMKLSIDNVNVKLCYATDVFRAIAATNLSINREYKNASVTIVRNIAILSVNGEIKLAFEVKNIQNGFDDVTVILGNDFHLLVHSKFKNFKEEFLIKETQKCK